MTEDQIQSFFRTIDALQAVELILEFYGLKEDPALGTEWVGWADLFHIGDYTLCVDPVRLSFWVESTYAVPRPLTAEDAASILQATFNCLLVPPCYPPFLLRNLGGDMYPRLIEATIQGHENDVAFFDKQSKKLAEDRKKGLRTFLDVRKSSALRYMHDSDLSGEGWSDE